MQFHFGVCYEVLVRDYIPESEATRLVICLTRDLGFGEPLAKTMRDLFLSAKDPTFHDLKQAFFMGLLHEDGT